jgi:AraC-like DNA-binding protein
MASLRRAAGETPGHRWQALFATPDPRLRPHVVSDYQGWQEWAAAPVFRPQLPIVMVPVILNLGPLWEIGAPDVPWGTPRAYDSFAAGLHDGIATTLSGGDAACLQINLTPLSAHLLFRRPMAELANRTIAFEELVGAAGDELIDRLRLAPDWEARFACVDHFLLAQLGNRAASREIAFALRQLQRSHGKVEIGTIAEDLAWSRKRLIARFQAEIGLTPKTIARLCRFNRMLSLLERPKGRGLAELAYIAGYYDQAHFNRDFRDFARVTPGEYLATLSDRPIAH